MQSYFARNRVWLNALFNLLLMIIAVVTVRMFGNDLGVEIPEWLQKAGIAAGLFCLALTLTITRTLSAQIMQMVILTGLVIFLFVRFV